MSGIRLGGIASGMDTENMVKQMVAAKRTKADYYERKTSKNEWLIEAYNEINQSMANFILNSRKKLGLTDVDYFGTLRHNSIQKVDWVNKATSTDEKIVKANARASAVTGKYSIEVEQLAEPAKVAGKSAKDVTNSKKLSELEINGSKLTPDSKGKITIKVNDKDIKLDKNLTVKAAIDEIKKEADINVNFDEGSKVLFMSSKSTGATKKIKEEGSNKLKEVENSIIFGKDSNTVNFFESLGISEEVQNDISKLQGKNAKIRFNGSEPIEYPTNDISINGIDLTLENVSEKDSAGNVKKEYITVSTNTNGIFDKVKEFVEEYNKIIDSLQSKLSEKANKKFQPLTKAERSELKDGEAKLWDEKAKSGLLSDDRIIRNMISDIRKSLYEEVNTTHDPVGKDEKKAKIGYMFELGITTSNWKEGAKLKIDENKLKDAIAKDPNKVLDILFQTSDDKRITINSNDSSETIKEKRKQLANTKSENGVFVRIMDAMNKGMENIIKHSGTGKNPDLFTKVNGNILSNFRTKQFGISVLGKDLKSLDRFMDEELKRLNNYEDSLWAKFSAMEKAIAKAQQQSGWITQQMGM